jgi:hypothetical protein
MYPKTADVIVLLSCLWHVQVISGGKAQVEGAKNLLSTVLGTSLM